MGIMFCEEGFPELPPRRRDGSKHPLPANIYEYACRALGVQSTPVTLLSADVEFTSLIQQLYAARGTAQERKLWHRLLQRVQELPAPRD